ncbi:hypothetical protein DJ83_16950 [Halorubrum ezzemoulense]|uniref:Uncharacterized protein n=1 Tax=Halorubrum ezzemoulense TaxID=337243 RepID=A0A256ILS4_HALEZ|nr:hypothetical protein DJ83_16950 [Halorubrum ezzemoulense]
MVQQEEVTRSDYINAVLYYNQIGHSNPLNLSEEEEQLYQDIVDRGSEQYDLTPDEIVTLAQEEQQSEEQQEDQQQEETESEQEDQLYSEDEVEEVNNDSYSIGSVTVTKLVYLEDGTIVATIDARSPVEITASYPTDGDGGLGRSFHQLEQGENKIEITGSYDGQIAIWAGTDGQQIRPPSTSIVDLPPSSWIYSWEIFFGGIFGTIVAIIYDYRRIMYNKVETVRSIFEIDWWR